MRVVLICVALALTGCTAANDAADALARKQAKTVVNEVMQARFPGLNIAPVTDCVIDAASAGEILGLARASVTQVTTQTAETVIEISTRREAVQCYAENGLPLLTGLAG
ncbi:succinate dehydrogenase [Roseovarius rhodophyticola]|uniref:Succinate dehydrogenase n=1 Tax=Roseovarius rhodophyticola TaxID=3080827 RepID=A0ABZ2TIP4_9RHOB|nr:succinate dehydrogenase [Roseovarius sp. W115]MDV2929877.1 succinate dehydrogenase [Roseovarius sp. W115]